MSAGDLRRIFHGMYKIERLTKITKKQSRVEFGRIVLIWDRRKACAALLLARNIDATRCNPSFCRKIPLRSSRYKVLLVSAKWIDRCCRKHFSNDAFFSLGYLRFVGSGNCSLVESRVTIQGKHPSSATRASRRPNHRPYSSPSNEKCPAHLYEMEQGIRFVNDLCIRHLN